MDSWKLISHSTMHKYTHITIVYKNVIKHKENFLLWLADFIFCQIPSFFWATKIFFETFFFPLCWEFSVIFHFPIFTDSFQAVSPNPPSSNLSLLISFKFILQPTKNIHNIYKNHMFSIFTWNHIDLGL